MVQASLELISKLTSQDKKISTVSLLLAHILAFQKFLASHLTSRSLKRAYVHHLKPLFPFYVGSSSIPHSFSYH